jgi:MarR family transcriptional regulator, organic hydroperoxide resistance regulator
MLDSAIQRMLNAYPDIFLACHRRHLRADQSGKGITERQASVLDHLDPARPTTLSKLAEHMGVSRSAMSIIVARLVRGGYVVQSRDYQDRRLVRLTLSAAGVRVKAEHSVLDPELLRRMLERMPAADLESSLRGLESLARQARTLLRQRKREHDP